MSEMRIGQVSSIDYNNGMIKVVYNDRDGAVTKSLPVFSFNEEYKMPNIGEYVLVAHLSNGTEAGCVLGTFWNKSHRPVASGAGVFRKELSNKPGRSYFEYNEDDGNFILAADSIEFQSASGSITLEDIITKLECLIVNGGTLKFTDTGGDVSLSDIRSKL